MKIKLAIAWLVIASTSASAWAQQPPPGEGAPAGTTLRLIPQADLRVIDPIWTSASITRDHGYMIYDTLFAMNKAFVPQPQMIQSWNISSDKLTYTFTLRDGLKFHDGKPVRAADCVASLSRWSKRDVLGQKLAERLGEYKVIDERSFAIVLKRPFPLLIASLARGSGGVPFIMPERIANTDANVQINDTIGSGPFKFVKAEWVPGYKAVYVKNPDYVPRSEPAEWASGGKVVRVDRVEWVYIPDASTAMAAFAAGDVDWWEIPPLDFIPLLEKTRGVTVDRLYPVPSLALVRLNHLVAPFDNPKLRRALLYAVDQREFMSAAAGSEKYWQTCFSYFPCGTAMASEAGAEPLMGPRDLERARQLVRDAGYHGEKIVLLTPTDLPPVNAIGLVAQGLLRRLGMNVELAASDMGTMVVRRTSKEPVDRGGWNLFPNIIGGADNLDPSQSNALRTNGDKAWVGWPNDPTIEKLRDEWIDAPSEAERKRIAADIQRRLFDLVPQIPVGEFFIMTAYRDSLRGVILGPALYMWNVSKQ